MCGFPISSLHRCMYNWCVIGVQREWYANNGGRNYGVMSGHIPHARCLRIFSAAKLGTLLGLCNSISTPNPRSNVKNALCELNVAYADTTVPAEPPLRYGREKYHHNIYN